MVDIAQVAQWLQLASTAAGALGGSLLFMEFFHIPNYVTYDPEFDVYGIDQAPDDVRQYTWAGRVGALLVAVAFAVQFVVALL